MPTGRNREDSVLDEIDKLVDWQLSGGDQSDSYHGNGFRHDLPCPWCREGYHFLPITYAMQEMRAGSYATDEFGAGIVDPDYDYRRDDSPILCPGSEFHGPKDRYGTWDKQSRERASKRSSSSSRPRYQEPLSPSLPAGRLRKLRFVGPFDPWTIALEDERVIEDIVAGPNFAGVPNWPGPNDRFPIIREQRLTATFEMNARLTNMTPEWIVQNQDDIENMVFSQDGSTVEMKPIVIPFSSIEVYGQNPDSLFPDWIELTTTYPIERHPWFMHFWMISGGQDADGTFTLTSSHPMPEPDIASTHVCCEECSPGVYHHLHHVSACNDAVCLCGRTDPHIDCFPSQGYESDIVIIDEAYEHDNEEVRAYVDQIQAVTRRLSEETSMPPTFFSQAGGRPPAAEAYDEAERRQAVFRRGEETEEGWTRQVDARARSREVQETPGATDITGEETTA